MNHRNLYLGSNEYHSQDPRKKNIPAPAAPAQDNGRPKPKGPAEKKKKSRVCIIPLMLWMICITLPFTRRHAKQILFLQTLQSTARYVLSEISGNAMLRLVNQISALYLQKGRISLSGIVILKSGQQQLCVPPQYPHYFDLMLIFQSSSTMTI